MRINKFKLKISFLVICMLSSSFATNAPNGFSIEPEVQAYVYTDHAITTLTLPSGHLDEILKLPDHEFISTIEFSPSQEKFCLVTGSKKYESTQLYLVDKKTNEKTLIQKVDTKSHITKPVWSPDSNSFVVLIGYNELQTGDFMHYEEYILKHYDLTSNLTTDLLKVKEPVNSMAWSNDSNFLAFNGKVDKSFSLYILNRELNKISLPIKDLSSDWVFKNLNFWSFLENKLFLVDGSTISSYDVKNKQFQQLKDVHKQIITQQWSKNKNLIAIITKEGEETFLDFLSLDNGTSNPIEKEFQIDSPRFSPDGQKISYFLKMKDQANSKLVVYEVSLGKKIAESESGNISIYPWDVDPTYSKWSNKSNALLFVASKENQTQYLSKLTLSDNQPVSISADWDYLYNYEFSPHDDWICLSGSRSEKEFIEFVSNDSIHQRITKPDLKFCEWKLDALEVGKGKMDSKSTSNKNLPILLGASIGVFFLILLIWVLARRNRKS